MQRVLGTAIPVLEAGADDYLPKPLYPEELLARIRRRLQPPEPRAGGHDVVVFEGVAVDLDAHRCTVDGRGGCADIHEPDLFMLDEPMTGLDPRAIRTLKSWVGEQAARGASVIVSSHLLSVVADTCTDLLVLVQGRLRFFGTLDEARARYGIDDLESLFFEATGT